MRRAAPRSLTALLSSLVHPHESMPATSGQDDVYQAFAEVDPSHGGDGGHGAGGLVGLSQEDSDAFKCALCLTDFTDYKWYVFASPCALSYTRDLV